MPVWYRYERGTCHDVIVPVRCFQQRWEALMLFYRPENQGGLAHTEVCAAVSGHLLFGVQLLQLVEESLFSVRKWRCIWSSLFSLVKSSLVEKGVGLCLVMSNGRGVDIRCKDTWAVRNTFLVLSSCLKAAVPLYGEAQAKLCDVCALTQGLAFHGPHFNGMATEAVFLKALCSTSTNLVSHGV